MFVISMRQNFTNTDTVKKWNKQKQKLSPDAGAEPHASNTLLTVLPQVAQYKLEAVAK